MMKRIASFLLLAFSIMLNNAIASDQPESYQVKRLKGGMSIDARWDKVQWKKIREIPVARFMGDLPAFQPVVKAKMMYDKDNLYLIYKVEDKHVRIQNTKFNSSVSTDACVEFFFSPDVEWPLRYFNLEINAGGTGLMAYHKDGKRMNLKEEDFKGVEIAHTLPKYLEKEIAEPVTWYLEVKLPLEMLRKYAEVTQPKKGVIWKANFYKTSSRSTNPHYITWSEVKNPKPQFHLPQFFGNITFR